LIFARRRGYCAVGIRQDHPTRTSAMNVESEWLPDSMTATPSITPAMAQRMELWPVDRLVPYPKD